MNIFLKATIITLTVASTQTFASCVDSKEQAGNKMFKAPSCLEVKLACTVYHLDENKLIKTRHNTFAWGLSGAELITLKKDLVAKQAANALGKCKSSD
jgi:hypothetical protein